MRHPENDQLFSENHEQSNTKKEGLILCISDLHYTSSTDEKNEAYLLMNDLKNVYFDSATSKIKLEDIDYIVICGDFIASHYDQSAMEKAFQFVKILSAELKVPAEKIIIVPGNNDLSWDITMNSYHLSLEPNGINDKLVANVGRNTFYMKRNNDEWRKKFTNYSKFLYEKLYNNVFADDPKEQTKVIMGNFIENNNIAFLMINTALQIDQFNPEKKYFDVEGLIKAVRELPEENMIKIVVGHHPLDLVNNYSEDIAFANVLQNSGFKIYLHGHINKNISLDFINPQNTNSNILMLGCGGLSEEEREERPIIPARYNVIRISNSTEAGKINVTVNSRQREYGSTYWQPAYIYYKDTDKTLTNIYSSTI